ncbi:MAG: Nif3-like dinuclear metal center hexameric protein [Candidatus Micrarchaeota archaeon]|nr:Nif3-like dinuclear metal center hexameric protein [Candidatus Micrarchaeota archaeon]
MAELDRVVKLLNKEVGVRGVPDVAINGLQVRASRNVKRVGLTTDACMDSFLKAKRLGCDLLVVHHGIFLKGKRDIAGIAKRRAAFLKKNHISLYAAHLPLDKSMRYGHNAYLLRLVGAKPSKIFNGIGYSGFLDKKMSVASIRKLLDKGLGTKSVVWGFGNGKVRKIAAVSGAGGADIEEAVRQGVELFVTGEANSWNYYDAKEGKINVVLAGHYKTETSGVKALGKMLEKKLGIETSFIDVPTGL